MRATYLCCWEPQRCRRVGLPLEGATLLQDADCVLAVCAMQLGELLDLVCYIRHYLMSLYLGGGMLGCALELGST